MVPGEHDSDPVLADAIFALVQEYKTRRRDHGDYFGSLRLDVSIQNGICVNSEVTSSVKKTRGKSPKPVDKPKTVAKNFV